MDNSIQFSLISDLLFHWDEGSDQNFNKSDLIQEFNRRIESKEMSNEEMQILLTKMKQEQIANPELELDNIIRLLEINIQPPQTVSVIIKLSE